MEFNPKAHTYHVLEGDERFKVPSVTKIVGIIDKSGPLINWAVNATLTVCKGAIQPDTAYGEVLLEQIWESARKSFRSIKADAADVGSQAHKAVEGRLRAVGDLGPPILCEDERVQNCVDAAHRWLTEHTVEPLEIERRIYSRKHKYSGTLDLICKVDGELCLVDWKSSNAIYPEFLLQTAAYVKAYEEETGAHIARRYLVRLGKTDGAFEAHPFNRTSLRKHYSGFLAAKKLSDCIQEIDHENRRAK